MKLYAGKTVIVFDKRFDTEARVGIVLKYHEGCDEVAIVIFNIRYHTESAVTIWVPSDDLHDPETFRHPSLSVGDPSNE